MTALNLLNEPLPMLCLSLWQPWASAMACGSKKIETRHWRPPAQYIGREFAIHATKRWTSDEKWWVDYFQREVIELGFTKGSTPPLGCIVGYGRLVEVASTESLTKSGKVEVFSVESELGNYEPGRFGWVFKDIKPIEPIPFKGQQGIWTLSDEVAEQVRRAVKS